ncbi:helix-turn-helix domain-containing protein [Staphylococcus sp. HMSC034C12]|uniref:winged helix-turn-helix transcriptional regulator n=1 Tax=Staphylococcus TaxID=1279 RepID=UPI000778ED67|nr:MULTISPECIES: winged helix-turn-helix transcriptional regulator [Staphylococcus]KAF1683191.1 HxlR family transcriptional regulator [Staphylococcus hominis]MBK1407372.1 winged helix-turn-helix transcriptional regulator [Staphylococcus hominis]MBS9538735.1 winged helix-turn-helix transcriptional regulator [Staphylococcus hominis subsp. novobiosepticus]MCK6225957.1 winged helix-turn-helix transcriptional regulator [Staphylococcus hominis]OAW33882.1 HxlR family transcriptional regulator [Staphy
MDAFIFIIFIQLFSYHRFFQYRNIERIVYPVVPSKVEYKLTNIGKTLDKVVYAICDWGDEFLEEISKQKNAKI